MFGFMSCERLVRFESFVLDGRFGFFKVSIRRRDGIHFRTGGHERRQGREKDGVRNRRFIQPASFRIGRFGWKVLMCFPF